MREELERHIRLLRVVATAMIVGVVAFAVIVLAISSPHPGFPSQGATLFWIFLFATVVNLVTIMPTYRYLLATPRRAYEVSRRHRPILAAHLAAHSLALARVGLVGLLGIVLFFIAGRRDWFWLFEGIAAAGAVILWPRRRKLEELLEQSDEL